MKKIYIEQTRA